MAESSSPKPFIDLVRGWPHTSLLPIDLIKEAAHAVLSDPSVAHAGLLYGPDPGYEPCREAVASWLTSAYQTSSPIGPDRICVTGGASQNLGNVLSVYSDPEYTRAIWIVVPGYMLAFRVFEDAGFDTKLRAVPEDAQGLDIAYLRREIARSEEMAQKQGNNTPRFKPRRERAKVYKHILYCVPSFSNPSSRTMSLQRRVELVQLAREFDMLVACDDVYDMLSWRTEGGQTQLKAMPTTLPRLVDLDRESGADKLDSDGFGNVVSNGTFSKIAGPGLRVGWAEGTPKFIYGLSQAGVQRSGGAPSQLTSTYVARLLSSGQIQNHIENVLRPAYASRHRVLLEAIKLHLSPLGFNVTQPDHCVAGGYFVWLGLPMKMDAEELALSCQHDENLAIAPGSLFRIPGDDVTVFKGHVRLCFAWESEVNLAEGIRRIAVIANHLLRD